MGKIRHNMAGISVGRREKHANGDVHFLQKCTSPFAFAGVPICVLGCPRVRSVSVGPHDIEDGEDQEEYR